MGALTRSISTVGRGFALHGADRGSISSIPQGSPRLPAVISEHRAGSGPKIKKKVGHRDPGARDRGLCSPHLSSLSGLCCAVVSPTMARHPMQGRWQAVSTAQSVSGLGEGRDRTHPMVGAFLRHLCRGQGTRPRPTGVSCWACHAWRYRVNTEQDTSGQQGPLPAF